MSHVPQYTVDQEVRVFASPDARYSSQPEGGWAGTVTKVGPTYVYVRHLPNGNPQAYDLKTGHCRDRDLFIKTLEEAALDDRHAVANQTLHDHGVRLHWNHQLTLEQLEALAEVARTFPATGK